MKAEDIKKGAYLLSTAPGNSMKIEIRGFVEDVAAYHGIAGTEANGSMQAYISNIRKTDFELSLKIGAEWFSKICCLSEFEVEKK